MAKALCLVRYSLTSVTPTHLPEEPKRIETGCMTPKHVPANPDNRKEGIHPPQTYFDASAHRLWGVNDEQDAIEKF